MDVAGGVSKPRVAIGILPIAAPIAVGVAAAVPWLAFVGLGPVSEIGLQPASCESGDLACTLTHPAGLLTLALVGLGGSMYGLAGRRVTGRGHALLTAAVGALALDAVAFASYVAVANNPIVEIIHARLGVGLDELTPWVGIAEAFGIAAFAAAFVVVLAVALAVRAGRPLVVALSAALAAAAAFVAVVVLVDPVLGVRLGAETIGTKAMPWTALTANFAAGIVGAFVGLRLSRPRQAPVDRLSGAPEA